MKRRQLQYGLLALSAAACGCHDGPLYALKAVNPVFRSQWAKDEAMGVTDTTRRESLEQLVKAMPGLPANEQLAWKDDLDMLMQNDPSAQNRFLAIQAAAAMTDEAGLDILAKGLQDDAIKVRIGSCQELAKRKEPRATELLMATAAGESASDVRLSAIAALSGHKGDQVKAALREVLDSDDPAYQLAAMKSLKKVTGASIPQDAEAWVAYLDNNEKRSAPSLNERLKNLF